MNYRSEDESPHLRHWHRRRGRRARARLRPAVRRRKCVSPRRHAEINAWVVMKPDDTVVIRIARSEMGQGTLTGLASSSPRSWNATGRRSRPSTRRPARASRASACGATSRPAAAAASASRTNTCARAAPRRAMMLIQAAANEWKVPASECTAANSVITHRLGAARPPSARWRPRPPSSSRRRTSRSRTRRTGRSPASRSSGSTRRQVTGKQVYAIDLKLPGMLNAAIKDCPVFGGKVKSFDAAKVSGMPGVKKVVQVGDTAVAVVADTWWHAKTALDALPIEWDEGPNAKVSSESIAEWLKEGLDAEQAFVGNQNGDAKAAIAGAPRRSRRSTPIRSRTTRDGADERHGALHAGQVRGLVPTQNGEARSRRAPGVRPAGDKCEVHKLPLGGGFGRRGASSDYVARRCDRQGDAGHAGQAPLVARRGHGAGPVPPGHAVQADVGGLDKDNNLVGLHMRSPASRSSRWCARRSSMQNGRDPLVFQGLYPSGEHAIGYTFPNLLIDHAMRNPHVPPGFWRGVNINQNASSGMLHGRAGAGRRPGPARVPAQADGKHPQATWRAQRRGRADRLGQAGAAGHASRPRAA
jgi:isoquinoline 1-oxidoreductase subunit beta